MSKFVQILCSISFPLGRVGVGLLLFALAACHTTSQAPLDDAYYWPDKSVHTEHSESSAPSAPSASSASSASSESSASSASSPSSSSIEYTNVQDTTVTIKIKR